MFVGGKTIRSTYRPVYYYSCLSLCSILLLIGRGGGSFFSNNSGSKSITNSRLVVGVNAFAFPPTTRTIIPSEHQHALSHHPPRRRRCTNQSQNSRFPPHTPNHRQPQRQDRGQTSLTVSMIPPPTSPPPPLLPTQNTPYQNPQNYQSYQTTIEEVFSRYRIRDKKNTDADLQLARAFLLTPGRRLPYRCPDDGDAAKLKQQMEEQRQAFLSLWNPPPPPGDDRPNDVVVSRYLSVSLRALTYLGDHCARTASPLPLLIAWDKIMEMGVVPSKNALSTYLYVLGTHLSSSSPSSPGGGWDGTTEIMGQVALLHDTLHRPTENTVTLRIKALVEKGEADAAERLVRSVPVHRPPPPPPPRGKKKGGGGGGGKKNNSLKKQGSNENVLKMRTCLPLFEYYCGGGEGGDVAKALSLYELMRESPMVYLDGAFYTTFLVALAREGYLGGGGEGGVRIEGAERLGYPTHGPPLLDRIMGDMAQDVLEIDGECARRIRNGFSRGFHREEDEDDDGLGRVPNDCELRSAAASVGGGKGGKDGVIACRVTVDRTTATCPRTNVRLRLLTLDDGQKVQIRETLGRMASEQYEAFEAKLESRRQKGGGGGGKEREGGEEVVEDFAGTELRSFNDWLDEREGEAFTVIVDGANVAYHRTGMVNYHLIERMVRTLEAMNERVLVVIPQKYTQRKFHLRRNFVQELDETQLAIIDRLTECGQLYRVPSGCLDDYYWMIASVAEQTAARGVNEGGGNQHLTSLDVAPENECGRWPGSRPSLISNDQMRDHRLELLEPRLFRRWSSTHIVNYNMPHIRRPDDNSDGGGTVNIVMEVMAEENNIREGNDNDDDGVGEKDNKDAIVFSQADFFSHEIQGNLPPEREVDGENNNVGGSLVWHIPVSDWDRDDRFCIRIPKDA